MGMTPRKAHEVAGNDSIFLAKSIFEIRKSRQINQVYFEV